MIDQHFGRFRKKRKILDEVRVNPDDFDNRNVTVFNGRTGVTEAGKVKMKDGKPEDTWNHKYRKAVTNEVETRQKLFDNSNNSELKRNKEVSEIMEHIFTDQFHILFPGFDIVIPDKSDDVLNGADVLAVKWGENGEIEAVFSFDFFFAKDKESYKYLDNKIIRTVERLKKGMLSTINFIRSQKRTYPGKVEEFDESAKVDPNYIKGEGIPSLTIAIDEEELAKLAEIYESENGQWQDAFLEIRGQVLTMLAMQLGAYSKIVTGKNKDALTNLMVNFPAFQTVTDPSKIWNVNLHFLDYLQKLESDKTFEEAELARVKEMREAKKKEREENEKATIENTSKPVNGTSGQSNRPNFRRNDSGQRHKGKPGGNQGGKGKPYKKR